MTGLKILFKIHFMNLTPIKLQSVCKSTLTSNNRHLHLYYIHVSVLYSCLYIIFMSLYYIHLCVIFMSLWEEHVDSLCKRISTALGGLRQACRYVPQETLITIYNALIKPLFDYCDIVWGNLNSTLSARLQKLQNRVARIITRKGYDERSLDIRKQLGWDDLETIRRKHTAILMYKIDNKKAPDYFSNLFTCRL